MNNKTGIPILYYHSIANHEQGNEWSFLSISISLFKKQMEYLYKRGYYACDWKELDDHINGKIKLPRKTVMFHFDDGFLDNWSVVFPIMQQMGFKYSILVTPEFIEKGGELRPFVSKTQETNKTNWWGYLNEAEIKHMSDSGLVDFQAHGYTHTWYEYSFNLLDIFDGNNFYPHLSWNKFPERKPYWLSEKLEVPIGYPVFEYKKSLELEKRFLLNKGCMDELISSYDVNKTKEENIKIYKKIIIQYKERGEEGEYESDEQSAKRLIHELKGTRTYLTNITDKPTDYIVFPGGGNSQKVIEACKVAGYKLVSKGKELNQYNSKLYQVNRYSASYTFPKLLNEKLNMIFLKLQLKRAKGRFFITKFFKLLRA